jgi:hypothetical protein
VCEQGCELAKKEKAVRSAYNDLLKRVHFDETTPPGERWHIMAILGELMQENKLLKYENAALNILNEGGE